MKVQMKSVTRAKPSAEVGCCAKVHCGDPIMRIKGTAAGLRTLGDVPFCMSTRTAVGI